MAFSSSSPRSTATRRLTAFLAAAVLVPGLAACGSDGGGGSTSTTTQASSTPDAASTAASTPSTATSTATSPATCKQVAQPAPRSGEPDLPKPRPAKLSGSWKVTMTTNCGSFTIALDTKRQPKTTASFKSLVVAKFYDGLTFHRIAPDFVIQGGDPAGDGTGGPGYSVHETPPADAAYTKGVVAMAKTGSEPDGTSGSQFYVVTAADSGLPPQYAIVGKIVSGQDTVDRIAALGTGQDGPPSEPVVISKAVAAKG